MPKFILIKDQYTWLTEYKVRLVLGQPFHSDEAGEHLKPALLTPSPALKGHFMAQRLG